MTELFLIAHLAGRTVAIRTADVGSVVDIGDIVAVPRAGAAVLGLTALRSRVVTVIDPCVALGLSSGERPATPRAIITRVDGHHYAILVEALDDVAPFDLHPLSAGLSLGDGWKAATTGLVERDGAPVLVLDLAVLVPTPLAACA